MPPPVCLVAAALDVTLLLEFVEDADELAPVVPERIGDRGLGLASSFVQKREDSVVLRVEAGWLEGLEAAFLDGHAEPLQEERRAQHELARRSDSRRICRQRRGISHCDVKCTPSSVG